MPANELDLDLPGGMFRSGADPQTVRVNMWRRNTGSQEAEFTFTELDGRAIVDGDIVLGPADRIRADSSAGRSVAIVGEEFRWSDGVIPFVAISEVADRVSAAIAHWEKHTPFRFVAHDSQPDFISFESLGGCFSSVGRQGGEQTISLGSGCTVGSAIHEIGHALGLWHEQSRADRDEHVQILFANISPQFRHNFDRHVQDGTDLGDYDFGSIMHYPRTAFSINGQPTIITSDGQDIGQRNGLSPGDIAGIRSIYPKLDWGQ
jgi:hypothetical protein